MIIQRHTSESLFFGCNDVDWHAYLSIFLSQKLECLHTFLSSPKTSSNSCSWYPLPHIGKTSLPRMLKGLEFEFAKKAEPYEGISFVRI